MTTHRGIASIFASLVALAPLASFAAPFTAGTVVVERIGDGTTAQSNASFPIAILEVTTSGSVSQTITLASSGANQQTDAGSATSNGYLNTYSGYVSVPGLNLGTGTTNAAGTNTKVNSAFDASGSVINRTLFPTGGPSGTPPSPFSGNNYRSSIATSGSTFYATGASNGTPNTGGAWYYNGSAFTQVSSTAAGQPTNVRNVEIYNNQLYTSSGASTGYGIWSVGSGLPTAAAQSSTLIINASAVGTGNGSPYGFVMFDTNNDSTLDLAYVADDRTSAGGGIQKWTFNGSAWSNSWALLVGASGTSTLQSTAGTGFAGIRGLAGTYDAVSGATLYATTNETTNNRLISILDTGLTTPSTYTTLQSAGANYVFRGVDLSPVAVPEPSSFVLAGLGIAAAGWSAWRRRVNRGHVKI